MIALPTFRGVLGGRRSYRTEVMMDNPVAYWRLGESSGTTAADEKGTYPGTYVGSPTLGVTGAVAGNTAITTASAKYATRDTAVLNGTPSFTLEAWSKSVSAANQNILAIGINTATKAAGLAFSATGKIYIFSNGNGGTYYTATSAASFNDGNWHHIVGVVKSSGLEVFVDSLSVASIVQSITSATDYNRARIGAWISAGATDPLIGSVDECALYSYSLSQERIAAHYNARNNI